MYIRLDDNQYPLSERDIRSAFPNTSFPQPFNPEGYAWVFPVPQPTFDQYSQKCLEQPPELTDKGTWQQVWEVQDLTSEELEAAQARKAADEAAKEAARIASLWQAAHNKEFSAISGSAIGLLALGVLQQKPKCTDVQNWIQTLWNGPDGYYSRVESGSTDTDYSNIGDMPYRVPELITEVYGG